MDNELTERVIASFKLTPDQTEAARERKRDVVVTAGAGCGKTLTLVARYASLLADGCSPRRVAAITFTKKAALEMRSRVRKAMTDLVQSALTDDERSRWLELGSQMDSARIGTIHSLCTEIIKTHPAEAGIDPRFEVLDEGQADALQAVVVEDCLITMVDTPVFEPLLQKIKIRNLRSLLTGLLSERLDAADAFSRQVNSRAYMQEILDGWFNDLRVSGIITELKDTPYAQMERNAGDKLAGRIVEMLQHWDFAVSLYKNNALFECAVELFGIRRNNMSLAAGKKDSSEYQTVSELRDLYKSELNPLLGGEDSGDEPLSLQAEQDFEIIMPLLQKAFDMLADAYKKALQDQHVLDFNDLEYIAQQLLLKNPAIRQHWQCELESILVDEFQDTNARQRDIVESLEGTKGRLFLVGDSRQSIYRFRGADVTVFKGIKQKITRDDGLSKELNLTYRAHEPLLDVTGDLLATAMACEDVPPPDYFIPFTPLAAFRKTPDSLWQSPHLEIILGTSENSRAARQVAARALASRLLELKQQEQVKRWDDVVLLFRASTGFPFYEDAFEEAGIPFVTVSGKGFYSRPEIRDLLNMMRALSDPTDDLSMAGLLRSPAFGLTDAALYQLRRDGAGYLQALQADLSYLNEADRNNALRALKVIQTMQPMVDRVPVAEILKKLVDLINYRAILATADSQPVEKPGKSARKLSSGTGGRLWRNIDKLLGDAMSSRQVFVRDFLDYLLTLNEAGSREGEAPAEAEGAVRLMTIHKAKGLEFELVVMADASRRGINKPPEFFLQLEIGAAVRLEGTPLLYRAAKLRDADMEKMENKRLLYVALTRAKNKLLISGHASPGRGGSGLAADGWTKELVNAAGLDTVTLLAQNGKPEVVYSPMNFPIRTWVVDEAQLPAVEDKSKKELGTFEWPVSGEIPLYTPLQAVEIIPADNALAENETVEPEEKYRSRWPVTNKGGWYNSIKVGTMVHKALELWLFPGDIRLLPLLENSALNEGLADESDRGRHIHRVLDILERLQVLPVWTEINTADERHHEIPYNILIDGNPDSRKIDLLYRVKNEWYVIDFKTDHITKPEQKSLKVVEHTKQILSYRTAIKHLLNIDAAPRLFYLDDNGTVSLHDVPVT